MKYLTIFENLDYFSLKRMNLVCRLYHELLKPHTSSFRTAGGDIIDQSLFRERLISSFPQFTEETSKAVELHPAFEKIQFLHEDGDINSSLRFTFEPEIYDNKDEMKRVREEYVRDYISRATFKGIRIQNHSILQHENITSSAITELGICIDKALLHVEMKSYIWDESSSSPSSPKAITLCRAVEEIISLVVKYALEWHEDTQGVISVPQQEDNYTRSWRVQKAKGDNQAITYVYEWPIFELLAWGEMWGGFVLCLDLDEEQAYWTFVGEEDNQIYRI